MPNTYYNTHTLLCYTHCHTYSSATHTLIAIHTVLPHIHCHTHCHTHTLSHIRCHTHTATHTHILYLDTYQLINVPPTDSQSRAGAGRGGPLPITHTITHYHTHYHTLSHTITHTITHTGTHTGPH